MEADVRTHTQKKKWTKITKRNDTYALLPEASKMCTAYYRITEKYVNGRVKLSLTRTDDPNLYESSLRNNGQRRHIVFP